MIIAYNYFGPNSLTNSLNDLKPDIVTMACAFEKKKIYSIYLMNHNLEFDCFDPNSLTDSLNLSRAYRIDITNRDSQLKEIVAYIIV